MNYNKKRIIIPLIIVVAISAVALIYLFSKSSEFKDKTSLIAAENALLEHDIELIEAEGAGSGNIDNELNELRANIGAIVDGRNVTFNNIRDHLTVVCSDAGIETFEIVVGEQSIIQAQGELAPALFRCDATITFYGEEGAGYGLLQGIEMSANNEYQIVSFNYVKDSETNTTDVGDWTIIVAVYYFGEE